MSLELPTPIAAYFRADSGSDPEAFAQCFTQDAVVIDEGNTYRGVEAVKRWKTETSAKFTYTCEPLAMEEKAGRTVVTCRLTGTFPGSPVDLRFLFGLEKDQIASLEIVP
jgi:hypothetical protein